MGSFTKIYKKVTLPGKNILKLITTALKSVKNKISTVNNPIISKKRIIS